MKCIRYGITSFICFHNFPFFWKHSPIEYVDVLVGGDNLSLHCSDINLRESRMLCKIVKIAWAFTLGCAQTLSRARITIWST